MTLPFRRPDGRPEAYDIAGDSPHVPCFACEQHNIMDGYPYKEIFAISHNGVTRMLCKKHLEIMFPDVVIVDPNNGFECRDLKGKVWREDFH